MDELLALFEENPAEERTSKLKESGDNLCRPAVAVERDDDEAVENILGRPNGQRLEDGDSSRVDMESRLGIRIVERQFSSLDLMDLMMSTDGGFVPAATLAAMSLKQWNRYLVDPAIVLDAATVCGRTTLTTVGVVFEASRTRMTSQGNAFYKLGVGTLRTGGPCLTVLLFGSAYSAISHLNSNNNNNNLSSPRCGPGTVVALVNPRLLPQSNNPNNHHETAVTLCINDPQQLVLVGRDGDFGQCQATESSKRNDGSGTWISHTKPCGHFIDRRLGPYCAKHRHKHNPATTAMLSSSSSSSVCPTTTNGHRGLTRMQQLRQQPSQLATAATITTRGGVQLPNHPLVLGRQNHMPGDPSRRLILPGGGGGSTLGRSLSLPPMTTTSPSLAGRIGTGLQQPNLLHRPKTTSTTLTTASIVTPPNRMQSIEQKRQLQPQPPRYSLKSSMVAAATLPGIAASYNGKSLSVVKASNTIAQHQTRRPIPLPHTRNLGTTIAQQQQSHTNTTNKTKNRSVTCVNLHNLLVVHGATAVPKSAKPMLNTATKKRALAVEIGHPMPRRRCLGRSCVNTDITGFDGSVAVPQPSRLLFQSNAAPSFQQPSSYHAIQSNTPAGDLSQGQQHPQQEQQSQKSPPPPDSREERVAAQILEKQAQVAEQLLGEQDAANNPSVASSTVGSKVTAFPNTITHHVKGAAVATKAKSAGGLFGSLTQADIDYAAHATSVFASEIQAEEYAKHRHAVVELEKEEQRKNGHSNKANASKGRIQVEWLCRDCSKVYRTKPPLSCQHQGHDLVRHRIVGTDTATGGASVDERRQTLNEFSGNPLNGNNPDSFTLGSGLEWAPRWGNRFS